MAFCEGSINVTPVSITPTITFLRHINSKPNSRLTGPFAPGSIFNALILVLIRTISKLSAVEYIPLYTHVFVEAVYLHRKYILIYWIKQRLNPYFCFGNALDY